MTQTDRLLTWLKKAVLAAALVLLCLLCVLTGLLVSIVMDLKRQVATLHAQTAQIVDGLAHLETSVGELIDPDRVAAILNQGVEQLPASIQSLPGGDAAAQQEIACLLDCIGRTGLRYEYAEKQRTAAWVAVKLRGKAVLFRDSIVSAEDFIDRVAAKTHEGALYYVIDKDGNKVELQSWLRERLKECRSSK